MFVVSNFLSTVVRIVVLTTRKQRSTEVPPPFILNNRAPSRRRAMRKYMCVAYLLWLTLGFIGAHHFYLGRDRHGFLWATTCAGIFGIGWLRDFWRIPAYVNEANEDETGHKTRRGKPSICSNLPRIIGQIAFGYFFRTLVQLAIPKDLSLVGPHVPLWLIVPLGAAFGTWMVSNVGRIKSRFIYSLLGAYVGELVFGSGLVLGESHPIFAVVLSMLCSTAGWKYRKRRTRAGCCYRFLTWSLLGALVLGLWTSFFYFNATVVTDDGETIRLSDAIKNFRRSQAWQDIKNSFWAVWIDFRSGGWEKAEKTFKSLADVEGKDHALYVLGLQKEATHKEIRERYYEMARELHPDRIQGEAEKAAAQEKMIEVNRAYEMLTKRKEEL